jgi:hypothetical protein
MGCTFSHPIGPQTVVIKERGNGQGCQCGPANFDKDSAINDQRLIHFLGQEEVNRKFTELNEIFPKKQANPLIFLFMVPFYIGGLICFGLLHGDSLMCTNVQKICNASILEPDLTDCNRPWCCPGGEDERSQYDDWYKNGFPTSSKKYKEKNCKAMAPSDGIFLQKFKDDDYDDTVSYLCRHKEKMIGCNCYYEKNRKGRPELVCSDTLFIQGNTNNYSFQESNFVPYFIIGMLCVQLGWILPFIVYMKKLCSAQRFLKDEFFNDWKEKGIQVSYIAPSKHSDGSLGFVVPSTGGIGVGERIVVAEVVSIDNDAPLVKGL